MQENGVEPLATYQIMQHKRRAARAHTKPNACSPMLRCDL